jgi:hypothetical protein
MLIIKMFIVLFIDANFLAIPEKLMNRAFEAPDY